MPISRSQHQGGTLQEFFNQRKNHNEQQELIATQMLNFIDWIDKHFINTQLIGLTSHSRVGIIPFEEKTSLNWKIIVSNVGHENFYSIQYKIPENKAPWDNAWVTAELISFEKLKQYFLIAMRESESWKGNEELNRLLVENQLNLKN